MIDLWGDFNDAAKFINGRLAIVRAWLEHLSSTAH